MVSPRSIRIPEEGDVRAFEPLGSRYRIQKGEQCYDQHYHSRRRSTPATDKSPGAQAGQRQGRTQAFRLMTAPRLIANQKMLRGKEDFYQKKAPLRGMAATSLCDGSDLSSPAFQQNGHIPSKYTCEGEDVSPPLA
jgi:hypothetical protein